jgi:uncharacterized protein
MAHRHTHPRWCLQPVLALLVACSGSQPDPGPVKDAAQVLTAEEESQLAKWHAALLAQYDIDFRVRTVASTDDLSRLTAEAFEELRVGSRSNTGRGLLLVIDSGGERVRLEVARQLEHVFVDSFVAYLEREQMAPFFASSRFGEGIVAATELIAGRAERGIARAEFDERRTPASSVGAGAESGVTFAGGSERPTTEWATDTAATTDPAETISAYLSAMAVHNASAALDLYTPSSRVMLAHQVVTRAQMDNVVRVYADCPFPEQAIDGAVAVVRYPPQARTCAPWLLQMDEEGRWRLDLVGMQRAFRFDTRNQWRIADRGALGPYDFAFED